jgi:hypothetical protein
MPKPKFTPKDEICCCCLHNITSHLDEGDGWRCHSLGQDAFQCECFLRKDKAENDVQYYNLEKRKIQMLKEIKGEK